MSDPSLVETWSRPRVGRTDPAHLPHAQHAYERGFAPASTVTVDPGQSTDLRVFLRAGPKALTETWTFPWRA